MDEKEVENTYIVRNKDGWKRDDEKRNSLNYTNLLNFLVVA